MQRELQMQQGHITSRHSADRGPHAGALTMLRVFA